MRTPDAPGARATTIGHDVVRTPVPAQLPETFTDLGDGSTLAWLDMASP